MLPLSSRRSTRVPLVLKLTLDAGNSTRFARTLRHCADLPRPRLLINCAHLPCLCTHGVAHLASSLLLLHQSGAKVMLRHVSPTLHRYLRLLRLDTVFRITPAAQPQPAAVECWSSAAA